MPTTWARRTLLAGAAAVAVVGLAAIARAQTNGSPERFTAMAVNMTNYGRQGAAGQVEITIDHWTSDAARDRLLTVLMDNGPQKLLDALQQAPRAGYIRFNGGLGWDLHYARRLPLPDGGERVVAATDRPIGFWEAANQPRSIDYPFTVIDLRVNKDGEGEGKMSWATKIMGDKDNKIITIEDYADRPVTLMSVKKERMSQ